ncbi:asparagine synthetase A [Pontibacter lucknowensis]|uniref:Asparaginyl-tRNA synthetase n=1 Tax=Pontibacter lucknowensis TaxID=1077936 RepID=A0A1N6V4K5_9BACT|nr:asparagine synthetase A [Pontibacter lucknowensis]SIQ72679.1 asparaginyl-tRNA synthetase [Pontibacter lucknowensis]
MELQTLTEPTALEATMKHLSRTSLPKVLQVQQGIIRATHDFMFKKGLTQLMPLMLSPITDPLNHGVVDASIGYADQRWSLTKSMIFHKQLALVNQELDSLYIVSPNVRLEFSDRADTGRHLFEFTQVDFEFRGKDRFFVMEFMEELVNYIFARLNKEIPELLIELRGELLPQYEKWPVYRTEKLEAALGPDYEKIKSEEATEPFWLINHKREFYDKEDPSRRGTYLNYDVIWPEGFGEGLSGAEREHEYHQILKRMDEVGTSQETFKHYLEVAKAGLLPKTAGAGFGVERMTRFICRLKDVDAVTVFSRKPCTPAIF